MDVKEALIKEDQGDATLDRGSNLAMMLGLNGLMDVSWDADWNKDFKRLEMAIKVPRSYCEFVLELHLDDKVASLLAYYDDNYEGSTIEHHQAFRIPEDFEGLGWVMDKLLWGH